MMGIVDTDFYTDENGVEMRKDTYANGTVIKIPLRTHTTEENPLTEQEQIAIDTALNVEYMVCLMEANLG